MAAQLMLEITDLAFAYAGAPVLCGVSLTAQPGELIAVTGRSGCGKTTLLRLVAGFERPQSGTIRLAGTTVAGPEFVPTHRRRVGIVPQEGALFPHLDVAGNVGYGLTTQGAERDRRVAELLELVDLAGLGRRYPRELSGGQQQRAALARTLAPRPDLLLLDEPFASLDRTTRVELRREVAAVLAQEQTTALLITHDRDEALSLPQRVAVLAQGRVAQFGTPEEVYRRPVDRDTALLLGDGTVIAARQVRDGTAETVLGKVSCGPAGLTKGPVELLIRPEQVVLDPAGVPALVVSAAFLGPVTHAVCRLADNTEVAASFAEPIGVGEQVRIGVRTPLVVV